MLELKECPNTPIRKLKVCDAAIKTIVAVRAPPEGLVLRTANLASLRIHVALELRRRTLPQRLRVVLKTGSRSRRLLIRDGGNRIGSGRGCELVYRIIERRWRRRRVEALLRIRDALQTLELGLLLGREARGRGAGAECG